MSDNRDPHRGSQWRGSGRGRGDSSTGSPHSSSNFANSRGNTPSPSPNTSTNESQRTSHSTPRASHTPGTIKLGTENTSLDAWKNFASNPSAHDAQKRAQQEQALRQLADDRAAQGLPTEPTTTLRETQFIRNKDGSTEVSSRTYTSEDISQQSTAIELPPQNGRSNIESEAEVGVNNNSINVNENVAFTTSNDKEDNLDQRVFPPSRTMAAEILSEHGAKFSSPCDNSSERSDPQSITDHAVESVRKATERTSDRAENLARASKERNVSQSDDSGAATPNLDAKSFTNNSVEEKSVPKSSNTSMTSVSSKAGPSPQNNNRSKEVKHGSMRSKSSQGSDTAESKRQPVRRPNNLTEDTENAMPNAGFRSRRNSQDSARNSSRSPRDSVASNISQTAFQKGMPHSDYTFSMEADEPTRERPSDPDNDHKPPKRNKKDKQSFTLRNLIAKCIDYRNKHPFFTIIWLLAALKITLSLLDSLEAGPKALPRESINPTPELIYLPKTSLSRAGEVEWTLQSLMRDTKSSIQANGGTWHLCAGFLSDQIIDTQALREAEQSALSFVYDSMLPRLQTIIFLPEMTVHNLSSIYNDISQASQYLTNIDRRIMQHIHTQRSSSPKCASISGLSVKIPEQAIRTEVLKNKLSLVAQPAISRLIQFPPLARFVPASSLSDDHRDESYTASTLESNNETTATLHATPFDNHFRLIERHLQRSRRGHRGLRDELRRLDSDIFALAKARFGEEQLLLMNMSRDWMRRFRQAGGEL